MLQKIKDNTIIITLLLFIAYGLTTVLLPLIIFVNIIRHRENIKEYLYNVLISLDQFAGTLLYNQTAFTISSYTYYLARIKGRWEAKIFEKFIDALFFKDHCKKSFENELNDYKQLLEELKNDKITK